VTTPLQIDIVADIVCPWCYIGRARLARALDAVSGLAVRLTWRSFLLNPAMPPGGMDRQSYVNRKFGSIERAYAVYKQIEAASQDDGIAFNFDAIARMPDSRASHRLIRWAAIRGLDDEFVERLFRAFFVDGLDIGDSTILATLAEECGLPGADARHLLESGAGIDAVEAEDREVKQAGIQSVPCFIIDGRYVLAGAQPPEAFLPLFDLAGSRQASA
jgi:predicted DsbA family dithiol-disulfide isomerase